MIDLSAVMLSWFVRLFRREWANRPAVIISTRDYHQDRQEAIMAAITSNVDRLLVGDVLISGWKAAGLLFPSTATAIIRTIKQTMIERRLGSMPLPDMQAIEENLREVLDL
jgi:mRNA-degrading endonuclease toxin of MazEF toxin-antitoxin module